MANSVDPDQTAPSGAVWSGSTLFVYVILSDDLVLEFLGHLPHANSADSDQTEGAVWSGFTLFDVPLCVLRNN